MKFRFCGDGDCPDWVLAEIISSLSPMPHEDLNTLVELIADKIINNNFTEHKIKEAAGTRTKHAHKTTVACVHFLLISAARYNVEATVLNEELMQLGLPKQHAAAVCSVVQNSSPLIRQQLQMQCFKINELDDVEAMPVDDDAIDCAKLSLDVGYTVNKSLQPDQQHSVHIDKTNIELLLKDMQIIKQMMSNYSQDSASGN